MENKTTRTAGHFESNLAKTTIRPASTTRLLTLSCYKISGFFSYA